MGFGDDSVIIVDRKFLQKNSLWFFGCSIQDQTVYINNTLVYLSRASLHIFKLLKKYLATASQHQYYDVLTKICTAQSLLGTRNDIRTENVLIETLAFIYNFVYQLSTKKAEHTPFYIC